MAAMLTGLLRVAEAVKECEEALRLDLGYAKAHHRLGSLLVRSTEFGGPIYQMVVQDLVFAVSKFIERGGSFLNYYMYHGGINFGRSDGGPFINTSYDYDAPP